MRMEKFSELIKSLIDNKHCLTRALLRASATGAAVPVNFGLWVHASVNFSGGCF